MASSSAWLCKIKGPEYPKHKAQVTFLVSGSDTEITAFLKACPEGAPRKAPRRASHCFIDEAMRGAAY